MGVPLVYGIGRLETGASVGENVYIFIPCRFLSRWVLEKVSMVSISYTSTHQECFVPHVATNQLSR